MNSMFLLPHHILGIFSTHDAWKIIETYYILCKSLKYRVCSMERRGGHEVLLLVKELLTIDSCRMVLSRVYTWDRIKYTNINTQSYSYLLLFTKLSKNPHWRKYNSVSI